MLNLIISFQKTLKKAQIYNIKQGKVCISIFCPRKVSAEGKKIQQNRTMS